MYCNHCGNNLPPESLFCNRCGEKLPTERHSRHKPSIPTPTVRPARRRLVVEESYANEPYYDDETDEYDETYDDEEYEDEDVDEVEEPEEEKTIFLIFPAFYNVGTQYLIAILLSVSVMALIGYLKLPLWIAFLFTVICFARPIYHHILHNSTVYKLTSVKIEIKSGLFSKTSRNIPLRHIQDVTVSETFKERLIGIGDVVIDSAAVEGKILMRNIKDPRRYADLILNQLQYWN